ncbi:hypothetical protein DPMN_123104 [Dreissena polymorpha]|uniref:C-type lectin domain-containing protein n=1 Tax=Dreissena polymorpha TaxID=45954 RepID=A0A9D4GPQ5_DREPO|nr:hypothetical protein DPMN_123104 [Dreissena polymorpha]
MHKVSCLDFSGFGFVLPSDFWIGSFWEYDGTNWTSVWPMCDTVIPVTWAVWDNGEPDGIGIQTCNRIHSTLKYRTYYCYGLYDALCEKSGIDQDISQNVMCLGIYLNKSCLS